MRFYETKRLGSGELVVTTEAAGFVDPYAGEQKPECAELSREELLELPGGRQALWAWQNGDDSSFTAERIAFMREGDREEVDDVATRWGNPWARELIDAGYPEAEVAAFIGSERYGYWRPIHIVG
jgi:hypothetical protein